MAATSPRKPRRASGRHRRRVASPASTCAQWLRVGAAGIGLAAALAGGQGIASAAPDDSSSSSSDGGEGKNSASESDGPDGSQSSAAGAGTGDDSASTGADSPDHSGTTADRAGSESAGSDPESGLDGAEEDAPGVSESELQADADEPEAGSDVDEDVPSEAEPETESDVDEDVPTEAEPEPTAQDPESDASSSNSRGPSEHAAPATRGDGPAATEEADDDALDTELDSEPTQPEAPSAPVPNTAPVSTESPSATATSDAPATATANTGSAPDGLDGDPDDAVPLPIVPTGGLLETLWLATRQSQDRQAGQRAAATVSTSEVPADADDSEDGDLGAASALMSGATTPASAFDSAGLAELMREALVAEFNRSLGAIPVLGTLVNAISLAQDLAELGSALLRLDVADIGDEIGDVTRDLVGTVPVFGAPLAANLYDLVAPTIGDIAGMTAAGHPLAAMSGMSVMSEMSAAPALAMMAATAAPVGSEEHFWETFVTVVNQLAGFNPADDLTFTGRTPIEISGVDFYGTLSPVYAALEEALNAHGDAIDAYIANPTGPDSQFVRNVLDLMGLFFTSSVPNTTFSDSLNMIGDLLNRAVPPYKMVDRNIITEAQIAGAVVGALVKILDRMLAGDWVLEDLEGPATAGGTAGALTPYNIDDMSFLTDAEPSIFTVGTYVALVAAFNRFKQVGTDMPPVMTGVTQGAQFGFTIPIYIDYYDPNGDNVTFEVAQNGQHGTISPIVGGYLYTPFENHFQNFDDTVVVRLNGVNVGGDIVGSALDHPYAPYGTSSEYTVTIHYGSANQTPGDDLFTRTTDYNYNYTLDLGGDSSRSQYAAGSFDAVDGNGQSVTFNNGQTYTSEGGALVTINTAGGGFTYTNTLPGASFFHRSTSEGDDRYDTVVVPVTAENGTIYSLTFRVEIIDGSNSAPSTSASVGNADALGVVRGTVSGSDSDGDTLAYSLVSSSVTGQTGNSAYTTNGGIVTLDPATGAFTYVSTATGGSSTSFQVQVSDGHGGHPVQTVTVGNTATITPADVDTSTPEVVTGSIPAPPADAGLFTGYALAADPSKGSVSFNPADGTFVYTRTPGLGHTTTADDSFTVTATDTNGRTVTLRIAVQPTVANTEPTLTLTTAPTVGNLSGTVQTSTGKLTFADPDGDAAIWPSSVSTSKGGTVTFAADGTFTYTLDMSTAERHAIARIGAAGSSYNGVSLAAYEDAFTATVADGYGGTDQVTVTVPIYAINSSPTITSGNTTHFIVTIGTLWKVNDADGDLTSSTKPANGNQNDGNPWYSFSRSVSTFNWYGSGGVQDFSASGSGDITMTVGDGYYVVTNGAVTDTPASGSRTD